MQSLPNQKNNRTWKEVNEQDTTKGFPNRAKLIKVHFCELKISFSVVKMASGQSRELQELV